MTHRISRPFAGRTLTIETGRLARQAAGSALVQFGDTIVLGAVTVSDQTSTLPFFPLTVEYREKSYAAGKIPGGFIKREGRPSDDEILAARVIDRSIRPLFPEGFKNEVQVFIYVLSADQENDADVLGVLAASVALAVSPVPWNGPIAGVRIARVGGEWVLNPKFAQLEESNVDLTVCATERALVMVEGGALEISESDAVQALERAHEGIRELLDTMREVIEPGGRQKMTWTPTGVAPEVMDRVRDVAASRVVEALNLREKTERVQALETLRAAVKEELAGTFPERAREVGAALEELEYHAMRRQVLEQGERVDGRDFDTVRPIVCETSILPRVHGSAIFTRGQTQALVSVTLGTSSDEQRIDSIDVSQETSKSFMLHYNFPPFSTGEVRPIRGVSRREIGHGMLAERALQPLLPSYDDFPYTIRIVSDILESNGSSSMASVSGGSLALMDAGVPMKAACAGVAMGLVKDGERIAILTDILGLEDHLGDMDFKVAGTASGITAIQMDVKLEDGLEPTVLAQALEKARRARLHILDIMGQAIPSHRPQLSRYAPRIITIQINPEKIGDLIGPKGKVIRGIQEQTGAEVNVEDTGIVTIAAVDGQAGEQARAMVEAIVQEPEVGRVYDGVVKSTTAFGAFVEILPGVEGLLHISELQHGRTEKTEDVVKKGDRVQVKLLEVDERGRMRLSRKALLEKV